MLYEFDSGQRVSGYVPEGASVWYKEAIADGVYLTYGKDGVIPSSLDRVRTYSSLKQEQKP